MSIWGGVYFQNSASSIMEQLIFFHDHTMMIMIMVMFLVGYMLINSYLGKSYNLGVFEGQELESIWTMFPMLFLLLIAFPSLRLLYLMEEFDFFEMSIKVMGHQWYWSYEYGDILVGEFDSYMLKENEMFRLLDVDSSLVVPYNTNIRMVMSSYDVIHSWTVPALGVKSDVIPGRLNQLIMNFNRLGIFYGQCSEICGSNHSFMPIMISVISRGDWMKMY